MIQPTSTPTAESGATGSAALVSPSLVGLLDRLRCPRCLGGLEGTVEGISCGQCGIAVPAVEGILRLAVHGTAETWNESSSVDTSQGYQEQYEALVAARDYNEAYRDQQFKQWSTARELRLLRELLGAQPRSEVLLDLPCGGGRLSGELDPFTAVLVEADIGLGQVLYAKRFAPEGSSRAWMTASAFHIPFRDGGVDGTVCCRLSHHLPTPEERERLVAELLRVSRCFVVMTFFDFHSIKNLVRRIRRPLNRKPPKMTMSVRGLEEIAGRHGARLVASPALFHVTSGHRYALMVKDGA